jgi:hypothetical protein
MSRPPRGDHSRPGSVVPTGIRAARPSVCDAVAYGRQPIRPGGAAGRKIGPRVELPTRGDRSRLTPACGRASVQVSVVPEEGLEPSCPCGQRILSPSCLPIPPLGLATK